jgi:hypothetical protein
VTSQQDIHTLYESMLSAANDSLMSEPFYRAKWPSLSQLLGLVVIALIGTAGLFALMSEIK